VLRDRRRRHNHVWPGFFPLPLLRIRPSPGTPPSNGTHHSGGTSTTPTTAVQVFRFRSPQSPALRHCLPLVYVFRSAQRLRQPAPYNQPQGRLVTSPNELCVCVVCSRVTHRDTGRYIRIYTPFRKYPHDEPRAHPSKQSPAFSFCVPRTLSPPRPELLFGFRNPSSKPSRLAMYVWARHISQHTRIVPSNWLF